MPSKPARKGGVELRVVDESEMDADGTATEESKGEGVEQTTDGVGVEEVVRLKQEPVSLPKRRIEDEVPMVPVEETGLKDEDHGTKVTGIGRATVLMGLAALVLIVLGVSLVIVFHGRQSGEDAGGKLFGMVEERPDESEPESAFSDEELEEWGRKAAEVAISYLEAESVEEVLPLIKRSDELKGMLTERWKPFDVVKGETRKLDGKVVEKHGRISVALEGEDRSGKEFCLVFERGEDEMKLDWEASVGAGDVPFEELKRVPEGESVRMRVFLAVSNFHPVQYPDDEYRCFRLEHPDVPVPVYGYTKYGSEVAERLAEVLNEGATLLARKRKAGAILVLENSGRGEAGQFTIAEVVQGGWIEND